MATAKRRDARKLALAHAQLVLLMFGDKINGERLSEFIRCGDVIPGGPSKQLPYDPDVEAKLAEIEANGGKLIVR
jgi:hypothetical protein